MKEKNDKITQAIHLLQRHYWGNIFFLALSFLLVLFGLLTFFDVEQPVSVTLERYAIMVPIIAIPFSLKYFAHRVKKTMHPIEVVTATELYKKASYQRLYTLSAVTLAYIVLYDYSRNMNFFWSILVLFVVFFFCIPSREEIEDMIREPEKEVLEETEAGEKRLREEIPEEAIVEEKSPGGKDNLNSK